MKTSFGISSWGNVGMAIGRIYEKEVDAGDADMELWGIIRRDVAGYSNWHPRGARITSNVRSRIPGPDVVLCAAPSHCVMEDVQKYLALGISTVDCFDNHQEIPGWRERLDALAKKNQAVSVLGAGWDPGFDSIFRAISGLVVPENTPLTTFGPGRSMGHTTTVKSLFPDIKDAVSLTLPGERPGLQKREVYIELNDRQAGDELKEKISRTIKEHPYFRNDETEVHYTPFVEDHDTDQHGGAIIRESEAAKVELKLFGVNALMTGAAMYGAARAAARLMEAGNYGCFTLAEIPPLDFIKGDTVLERLARIKY